MNGTRLQRYGGLLLLALALASGPLFLQNGFHYNVAILAGLNAIVCIGLNLLIGYAGQISLGHAGFYALGAYASAILPDRFGFHPLGAMITGAVAVGLIAFAVARPILRLKGHYLAMATLGMGIIVSIVLDQEVDITGGPDGMPVGDLSAFGYVVSGNLAWYTLVAILLFITVWLALNLVHSPVGRALKAVHGSEIAAAAMGVDVFHYKVLVFVVSAIIASVAGSIFAHYSGFITPDEGSFIHSIELVTMVVLGGMASITGSIVGAVLLTVLPQMLADFHDYEMIVFGAILMGMMILMPKGLVPTLAGLFKGRRS